MPDSFLRYWLNLENIIPIKVDLVEAGLASGLPCDAARPPVWVTVTIPKGHPSYLAAVKTSDCEGCTHYDATTRLFASENYYSLLC